MLAHRLRRWPNMNTTLVQRPVFADGSLYRYHVYGDRPVFVLWAMPARKE